VLICPLCKSMHIHQIDDSVYCYDCDHQSDIDDFKSHKTNLCKLKVIDYNSYSHTHNQKINLQRIN
jgi:hypothetical protein